MSDSVVAVDDYHKSGSTSNDQPDVPEAARQDIGARACSRLKPSRVDPRS
jgi:hypothetical protein